MDFDLQDTFNNVITGYIDGETVDSLERLNLFLLTNMAFGEIEDPLPPPLANGRLL